MDPTLTESRRHAIRPQDDPFKCTVVGEECDHDRGTGRGLARALRRFGASADERPNFVSCAVPDHHAVALVQQPAGGA
jgi:hypothetical protein